MKAAGYVIIAIGITLVIAWNDYSWSRRTIANKPADWTVVSQKTTWSFLKPWTWIEPAVNRVLLVQPKSTGWLNSQYLFARTLSMTKGDDPHESMTIVDRRTDQFAQVDSKEEFQGLTPESMKDLFWIDIGGNLSTIRDLYRYLNDSLPPRYYMISFLGDEIDVTDLITSGNYRPENDSCRFCVVLFNNSPRHLSMQQVDSLQEAISAYGIEEGYGPLQQALDTGQINYEGAQCIHRLTDIYSYKGRLTFAHKDTAIHVRFVLGQIWVDNSNDESVALIRDEG